MAELDAHTDANQTPNQQASAPLAAGSSAVKMEPNKVSYHPEHGLGVMVSETTTFDVGQELFQICTDLDADSFVTDAGSESVDCKTEYKLSDWVIASGEMQRVHRLLRALEGSHVRIWNHELHKNETSQKLELKVDRAKYVKIRATSKRCVGRASTRHGFCMETGPV